jgi:hypothetical protein
MGMLNSFNILQIEAMYKNVKEAYQNSNKVDYVAQMFFWNDLRLLVESRQATL